MTQLFSNQPMLGTIYIITITLAIAFAIGTYLSIDVPKFSFFLVSVTCGVCALLSVIIAEAKE